MFPDRKNALNKLRLFSLLFFALTLPYSIMANNVAIILLSITWFFESSWVEKWNRMKQNTFVYYYLAYFALLLIGLSYTQNMDQGFFELEKNISFVLLPLILSTSSPISKRDLRFFFKAFIISCTAATFICIVYGVYRNYEEGHTFSYVFSALFFDIHLPGRYYYFNYWYFTYELFSDAIGLHPIYFSMYITFSSCLVVWLWWDQSETKKGISLWIILFLIYNFIVIVLLSSKTQLFLWLTLCLGFGLYYSYLVNKIKTGLLFIFLILTLGLSIIYLNPVSWERYVTSNLPGSNFSDNKYGEGGLSLRTYKWAYTAEAIRENPLWGTGTGDMQDLLNSVYKKHDFKIGYENNFNPHNQYLQSALELGLPGFSILVFCFFMPAYYAIKQRCFLYVIFIFLFSFSCLSESMLSVHKGIVFYAMFNSLFAFHFLNNKNLADEI